MPKGNELGTLIVVVLKARNLNDKHFLYKQDVFAQLSLNGTTKRTHIDAKGGQHPVWDAELRFPVMVNTAEKHRKLEVACYCKESKSEDILGHGSVDITETLKNGEFDDWIPLNIDGVVRGDIYLEMTFYANKPAPATLGMPADQVLARRPSKLSPSERLYRIPQSLLPAPTRPPSQATSKVHQQLGNNTYHSGGEPSRHSVAPAKRAESPLPPLPEQATQALPLPQILVPSGGRTQSRASNHQPSQVPSILRPRNETSSPTPAVYPQAAPETQRYDASVSLPYPGDRYYARPSPAFEYSSPLPHANHYVPTASALAVPYPLSTSPQMGPNFAPSGPPSFLIPTVPPSQQSGNYPVFEPQPFSYRPPYENDLIDPYLQARYQTPLPLPPESPHSSTNPTAPPHSTSDNRPNDTLPLKEEQTGPQNTQEELDRELALQLDRELNLAT
ncbi:hypothetical protein L208DRAFT_1391890 [Tricholoma matsutake]|nr:hypothetical protein L208DRAFT_1391890 [Tricholoma matsutake 945]